MNRYLKFLSIPFLTGAITLGCSDSNVNPSDTINPVQIPSTVADASGSFAFDVFEKLRETETKDENIFISPLSLNIALGMLLNGSENVTASEILKALNAEGISLTDLNGAYQTLVEGLPKADRSVNLGLANSVWYKSGFQVEKDFQDILSQSFRSDITGLIFDNAAKDKINKWASNKTEGKIQKVLDKIETDHVMFLLNALYFKGIWQTTFDSKQTTDTPFTLENKAIKNVKMMTVKSSFKAAETSEYKAVQLPYGNGQFNMTLFIPKGQNSIDQVLNNLDISQWKTLINTNLKETNARVGVPRFTMNYSVKLENTLKALGIEKVFTDQADLQKINKTADLYVNFVKQDTYLGIDEQGTEAAAVTSIGVGVTSAPAEPTFICDRPFGLVISENTSNTILFMGRIKNPDSK